MRFEYMAKTINGNFFEVALTLNNDPFFYGWELVQLQYVNSFYTVAMLKRPVIIEPFQHITGVSNDHI